MKHDAAPTKSLVGGRYHHQRTDKTALCWPAGVPMRGLAAATQAPAAVAASPTPPVPQRDLRLTAHEADLLLSLVLSSRLCGGEAERTLLGKLGDYLRQF